MKIARSDLRRLILEQIKSNLRNKGSWKKWVSEDDINEIQGMTKNPFSVEVPGTPPQTPKPVINGSVNCDGTHTDAVRDFMINNNLEAGDYNIVCTKGPGNTWACVASVSNTPMSDIDDHTDEDVSSLNDPNKTPWDD